MKAFAYFLVLLLFMAGGVYYLSGDEDGLLSGFSIGETEEADEDDDSAVVDARRQLVQGSLTVKLSPETQKLAGIKTLAAENITLDAENKAYASVIDVSQLIELRARYRNTQAKLEVIRTQLKNSVAVLERLEKLNVETTNISVRELQQARANKEKDKALFNAEIIRLDNIRAEMLQKWNRVITDMALSENSEIFKRLVNQEEYLLLMTLSPEQRLASNTAFVYINRVDDRNTARKAYLLSPAPYSDTNLRGETYFLRANAEQLRIGMRLYLWLPDTGYSGTGISIPDEAIIWYAGKAWAYVQIDDETFRRRSLPESLKTRSGWLVNDNFNIGDKIVISGAQTLLSEEFKWAIPDEDDD